MRVLIACEFSGIVRDAMGTKYHLTMRDGTRNVRDVNDLPLGDTENDLRRIRPPSRKRGR